MLKRAIHRTFSIFGIELRRRYAPGSVGSQIERTRVRCQRFVHDYGITLLLDIGANIGQYGHAMRALGYKGRIVSFEPLSEAYNSLSKNAHGDAQWECRNLAIGNIDGRSEINVAGISECSSLLPMTKRHVEALPQSKYRRSEGIEVARLDSIREDIANPSDRIWMKLDVQGFEKNVLLGAKETLAQVQIIDTELSLTALYDGQPLLEEMLSFLKAEGFEPISLENGFLDPHSSCALQIDGIFARRSTT